MALDRDLNVALIGAALGTGRSARGLDLLAATGARGLRLLAETDAFGEIVLIDRNGDAVRVLAENAAPLADRGARVLRADARQPPVRGPFDLVDVDPFGTPVPYLGAAIDLVRPGGLLAVTATDMPVLCGVARGVAERRYGGRPVRGRLGPEGGLRLLLAHLAARARARDRALRTVAGYVHDHHVRAIVRLDGGSPDPDPVGTIDPAAFEGPRLPVGEPYGPLWTGPLFDPRILDAAVPPPFAAEPRAVDRWLETFRLEAAVPALFYYETNVLASELGLPEPPAPRRLLEMLRSEGHAAAPTHARPGAIRTSAPRAQVHAAARRAATSGPRVAPP